VHLLLLGNSNESVEWFDGGETSEAILRRRLAEEFHTSAEVTAKSVWPDAKFPATLQKWLARYEPDVVYLNVVSFWFQYESVPLRMERLFGRFGKKVSDAGFSIASNRALAHNRPFRALRAMAQRTIGGDNHFTPHEVVECMSECIRLVLRREGTVLVVSGPGSRNDHSVTPWKRRRNERRRQEVHGALKSLCEQLHVQYEGAEQPKWRDAGERQGHRVGDGLHLNAAGHARRGDEMFESVRTAWATEQERYASEAR